MAQVHFPFQFFLLIKIWRVKSISSKSMSWFLLVEMFFPGFCRQENVFFSVLCSSPLETFPFVSIFRDIFPYLPFWFNRIIIISLIYKKKYLRLRMFHCTKTATLQIHCYCGSLFLRTLWQGDKGENFPENTTKQSGLVLSSAVQLLTYFYLIDESQPLRDGYKTKYCTFCDRMQNILKI